MVTQGTIRRRVNRGAAWLDKVFPDWVNRINLESLKLVSGERCVLGQLFGDYYQTADFFFGNHLTLKDERLGFSAPVGQYGTLEATWKRFIKARRKHAEVTTTRALEMLSRVF